MTRGKLVLVVAPSGSGKNTLIEAAKVAFPLLATLVTCTTRAPRPGEIQDVSYHFLTFEKFDAHLSAGDFLEWAEYGGNRYGTLRTSIEKVLALGDVLLATIEVQGARQARALLPTDELITIYVDAGDWTMLSRRITARAPISDVELEKRHQRYLDEATFKSEANYVIENPDGGLEEGIRAFVSLVGSICEDVAKKS